MGGFTLHLGSGPPDTHAPDLKRNFQETLPDSGPKQCVGTIQLCAGFRATFPAHRSGVSVPNGSLGPFLMGVASRCCSLQGQQQPQPAVGAIALPTYEATMSRSRLLRFPKWAVTGLSAAMPRPRPRRGRARSAVGVGDRGAAGAVRLGGGRRAGAADLRWAAVRGGAGGAVLRVQAWPGYHPAVSQGSSTLMFNARTHKSQLQVYNKSGTDYPESCVPILCPQPFTYKHIFL